LAFGTLATCRGKKLLDLCKLIEYKISSKLGKRRISKTLCESAVQTFKAGVLTRIIVDKFIVLYLTI
jgi:hypothetical protein